MNIELPEDAALPSAARAPPGSASKTQHGECRTVNCAVQLVLHVAVLLLFAAPHETGIVPRLQAWRLDKPGTLYDIKHSILLISSCRPICRRLPGGDERLDLWCELISLDSLSGLTPEENSARPSGRNSGTDSFPQQIASGDSLLLSAMPRKNRRIQIQTKTLLQIA